MRKKEIDIPSGAKKVTVCVKGGMIDVTFQSEDGSVFWHCPVTQEVEELPKIGDLCIFWNGYQRDAALIANLSGYDVLMGGYTASCGGSFTDAIKFRNYEQYLRVRGRYEDEP